MLSVSHGQGNFTRTTRKNKENVLFAKWICELKECCNVGLDEPVFPAPISEGVDHHHISQPTILSLAPFSSPT